ncbi:translation initiation factor IF-2 [bacterium]|nr:translation initiation factor IF-2 [bacterium]
MEPNTENNIVSRPPVVVVLGHVDHGKSSLLCAIKDFKITEKESGGITQHIGAYEIEHEGKKITFIDTPGHEAFSAMRSRGAKVADIAILVVAAEEGVKPQTKEVISHIKTYSIPVIVAINKIDKPEADPPRVKRELAQNGILVESEGGKIPCVEVSAKTKQGIDDLLDLILLVAEMEDLKADLSKPPSGVIIESYLDSKRGPTATLLLKEGILKKGDIIGTDSTFGKIRILEDFQSNPIEKVFPSMPAIVVGFEKVPIIGEKFKKFPDSESAQQYIKPARGKKIEFTPSPSTDKTLNLIIKADVLGSLEAIEEVLKSLPQERGKLRIIKAEVGEISEGDIKLATSCKARIIGFRTKINSQALRLAQFQKIKILTFDVIYDLAEAVRNLMEKAFRPREELKEIGKLEVLAIFRTEKNRQIVGGKVIEGEIKKGSKIEVFENEEKKGEGRLISLQQNKKEVEKVETGKECGILYEGNTKIKEGDILIIKAYVTETHSSSK